jgi:hypothetical protein
MVRYYTADEVMMHNCAEDCWVSIFDQVYDITSLIQANRNTLAEPLIKEAGRSVSHWFDQRTGNVKVHMDPGRNIEVPFTPQGRFIHVAPADPTDWATDYAIPWWKDEQYMIGKLTTKKRLVRIVNMLTHSEDVIQSCKEETVNDILDRYVEYNKHAKSYTWKALIGDDLISMDMTKTLELNGVPDETETFYDLGMNDDYYIPTLHIYYNDDLTIA